MARILGRFTLTEFSAKKSRVNRILSNYSYSYSLILQVREHLSALTGSYLDQGKCLCFRGFMPLNTIKMFELDSYFSITIPFYIGAYSNRILHIASLFFVHGTKLFRTYSSNADSTQSFDRTRGEK